MTRFTNYILDVDGTLIDPVVGLTSSMRYAFEQVGVAYDPDYDRGFFIGPPLSDTLRELLPNPELVPSVLEHYRHHFGTAGYAMCRVYPGIPEILADLAQRNALFVATARIQRFTELLMNHFGLSPSFTAMYGTSPDGRFNDKADLVRHIIEQHNLIPQKTAIIGDRRYDILAGKAAGIATIGVTYGYGTQEELEDAGADTIVHSVEELRMLLEV